MVLNFRYENKAIVPLSKVNIRVWMKLAILAA